MSLGKENVEQRNLWFQWQNSEKGGRGWGLSDLAYQGRGGRRGVVHVFWTERNRIGVLVGD